MINSLNPPPIPAGWCRSEESVPPSLAYIYGQVLLNGRGAIGYLNEKDQFVLYLEVEKQDTDHSLYLDEIKEIWVVFDPKFGMKGA